MQGYCNSGPESCAFLHDVISAERKRQLEASGEIPASAPALPPTHAIAEFPPLLDTSSQLKKASTTTVHSTEAGAAAAAAAATPPSQSAATEILQSLFGSSSASRSSQQAMDRRSSPSIGTPSYRDAALRAGSSKPEPEARGTAAAAVADAGWQLAAASAKFPRGAWVAGGDAVRTDYEATRAKARELAIARNNLYMEATKSFVAGGKGAARDLAMRARAIDIEMRRHHQEVLPLHDAL
jgi:hypothetical protein